MTLPPTDTVDPAVAGAIMVPWLALAAVAAGLGFGMTIYLRRRH